MAKSINQHESRKAVVMRMDRKEGEKKEKEGKGEERRERDQSIKTDQELIEMIQLVQDQ